MVLAVLEVHAIKRVFPFAVEIVNVMAPENVSVEAEPTNGVFAAIIRPEIDWFAAKLAVTISPAPIVIVGCPSKLSFENVIGSVVPVKVYPGWTFAK